MYGLEDYTRIKHVMSYIDQGLEQDEEEPVGHPPAGRA